MSDLYSMCGTLLYERIELVLTLRFLLFIESAGHLCAHNIADVVNKREHYEHEVDVQRETNMASTCHRPGEQSATYCGCHRPETAHKDINYWNG